MIFCNQAVNKWTTMSFPEGTSSPSLYSCVFGMGVWVGPALLTLCSLVSVHAFFRHCVFVVAVAFSIEWICQFDDELLLCFL